MGVNGKCLKIQSAKLFLHTRKFDSSLSLAISKWKKLEKKQTGRSSVALCQVRIK
jgi:hypothetical protein